MTSQETPSQATPWRATVLTLFPDMFPGPLGVSLAGKALATGLWALEARDIRASATDRHRSVDDTPAGGGPGMVLRADVLAAAIDAAGVAADRPRLLMSPRGRPLTQPHVAELAAGPGPLIVCGRFEGIDQRVIEARGLEEVSIGDYVLSGGEIAAMALIDACVRLLPGVMGKLASGTEESFSEGLLEYPQYTRPQEFEGRQIPEILISGDHAKVAAWRLAQSEALTAARRPDLWARKAGQKPARRGTKNTTDG
ncbi:tRNA (guanosine(37)-N1)-methyltransferase TrmD [Bradyrhizobium erythrophlei]|uniref:tRNA (guanine-N(1)-)-methyltransferase n=1 Tax=Bradyrhizobium erythrophlei TaxID=1437360 RepID=A0A1H5CK63_9BRAD|nr:tRNA (guanosine(37)-N1)-methyltransferase TrmD [Bradyrhizobium erythrophlei]SED66824.1 tRNA (Guanine37-N(1)-) methyltransferase [Bradyrhizobium erythrophlei]